MKKIGRPTKYSKELLEKAFDYAENYRNYGDVIPCIGGLALVLGVHKDTIYEWAKRYPEFSDMLKILHTKQVKILINLGLVGKVNTAIVKLLLAKQGYTERQELSIENKKIVVLDA
ncbi:hypothetical protein HRbin35_00193 [bacterium HR35]|nr:hypothetical protein HRbin35_00193 [bacterium HR35]